MDQRSPEWYAARVGKATASKMNDILAKIKTGEAASRRAYRIQLATERLTGLPTDVFVTRDMERGMTEEPLARAAYEFATGNVVTEIGLVDHPVIPNFAASPDGLIGKHGLVEIKNPRSNTHVEWLMDGRVPTQHKPQMLAQIACTGRKWCDFVSYDSRLPDNCKLFVVRYTPSKKEIEDLEANVSTFLAEVDEWERLLKSRDLANHLNGVK